MSRYATGDGLSVPCKRLISDARIDLLITDVGLPGGMNGRQVADAARARRPDLKILFIPGYAENAVIGSNRLDEGMFVMTKPFQIGMLATRIREIIELTAVRRVFELNAQQAALSIRSRR